MSEQKKEVIHSRIWQEEAEPENPFAAKKCFCSGYDVYGDLLGKISWIEYLYLLFKLDPPSREQANLLETIAVAIANPGPRDLSVRAAMNAGVGGSTSAASLMAALAPGAGQYTGAKEVLMAMELWRDWGLDTDLWTSALSKPVLDNSFNVWPDVEHVPGFNPYGIHSGTPVSQVLENVIKFNPSGLTNFLYENLKVFEDVVGYPLSMGGVAAAVFIDLEFSPEQGEMLYLLLRLPGAAAHSLEQRDLGWRKYPFFADGLTLTKDSIEKT